MASAHRPWTRRAPGRCRRAKSFAALPNKTAARAGTAGTHREVHSLSVLLARGFADSNWSPMIGLR